MKTILLALVLSLSTAASAHELPVEPAAADSTLHSYLQARTLLARAIEVAGGETAIHGLRNVSLSYAGHRNMINQSRGALPPWDREPASGAVVVDREGERMFAENYTSYPGIGRFGGAWALKGDQGAHWEPARNHHGSEVIVNFSGRDADGPWAFVPRWIPGLMLLDAWNSGTNLRSLGSTARNGKPMHALAWTQRDGATLTLLIDAGSGAFSGYESIRDDGVYGDATDRVEYSDWREIGGVSFPQSPHRLVQRRDRTRTRAGLQRRHAACGQPFRVAVGLYAAERTGSRNRRASAQNRRRRVPRHRTWGAS